jgi:type IV secretory pathway VirB2 component (pilin)
MLTTISNRLNRIFTSFVAVSVFFLLTDPAMAAAPTTGLETVVCNALIIIQGGVGRGIAAFAIIFIGISLFLGKVSWGVAISTALGIAAIFGAGSIVSALGGGGSDCDSSSFENIV